MVWSSRNGNNEPCFQVCTCTCCLKNQCLELSDSVRETLQCSFSVEMEGEATFVVMLHATLWLSTYWSTPTGKCWIVANLCLCMSCAQQAKHVPGLGYSLQPTWCRLERPAMVVLRSLKPCISAAASSRHLWMSCRSLACLAPASALNASNSSCKPSVLAGTTFCIST